ncbi:hypothetical protein A5634_04705 [Mycobacterium asiaticum]|uniref:PE domain-containing protein n=1 Tax=Mycobacterium asiaticum TaxID=1790 RepID=A0A1A3NR57_MYCAS|nr:hypothetical protein A5634_04705 [Mycobacterium asiaticum]
MAAGADDVSAAIAALFGAHAQAYQQLSAQAAQFHQQFVQLMTAGAAQYAGAEAANATPMQQGATYSTDPGQGAAAAARSGHDGGSHVAGAVNAVGRGGPPVADRAAPLSPAAGGSAGLVAGNSGVVASSAGSHVDVAAVGDVTAGEAGGAGAFAPGFIGGNGALLNGQPAVSPAAAATKSETNAHTPAPVQHVEVEDAEGSGWLHGDRAPVLGRALDTGDSFFAPAARDFGPGSFGPSGAGAGGVLGQPGIAAPAD